ncbi:MAG TPA: hypothetical protein VLB68_18585 [Pyrinomonadaceae bacterium]|nr:hypothetical protein [Pyrinomonadaceae bacterium]
MSATKISIIALMVSLGWSNGSSGSLSPGLTKVAKAIECSQGDSMPRWKIERLEPTTSNETVLVVMFVSDTCRVKVSILEHVSAAEATASIKQFGRDQKAKAVPGLGDEAYVWGYNDAIAFRKDKFNTYISAVSFVEALASGLDQGERANLRRTEEIAFTKSLAVIMASMLTDLDQPCRSQDRVQNSRAGGRPWQKP